MPKTSAAKQSPAGQSIAELSSKGGSTNSLAGPLSGSCERFFTRRVCSPVGRAQVLRLSLRGIAVALGNSCENLTALDGDSYI